MSCYKQKMKSVKLRNLEGWLQDVEVFGNPKVKLEQYPTTPHIAAHMLFTMHTEYDDVQEKTVADLGVGCGVLGIGCCMLGASYVLGVDVDEDALSTCAANLSEFEIDTMDLLQCDVQTLASSSGRLHQAFDTVLMNPPFGTKVNEGIDMLFLQAGLNLASTSVYSLHKTSTRKHILNKASEWGVKAKVIAELRFDLANTLKCHKHESVDIEVDFYRFSKKGQKTKF